MLVCLTIEGQENVSWQQWVDLAEACETNGFDGLFRSDHYLPFRRPAGWGATDAWSTITALGGITRRIRLGSLVSPIGFRHPSQLAKVVVTADHVSSGRVELGLGAGWLEVEHRAFGFPFASGAERSAALAEYLEVVHRLWDPSEQRVTFRGDHYQLDDCDALPNGVQDPHPPLIVGGSAGPEAAALAARWADEYNLYFLTPEEIPERRDRLSSACEAIGRDPGTLRISLLLNLLIGSDAADLADRAQRLSSVNEGSGAADDVGGLGPERLVGTPAQIVERLQVYADAGIQRVFLQHLLHEDLEAVQLVGEEVLPYVATIGVV
jgi:alkanesulfonate monooxygenase SsuD/methylene tetrahydromethanopterin reductase-like flavin-dependent oxidoreductase (luciferase family)